MGSYDIILLGFLACIISSAWATECYKCSDFEAEASNTSMSEMLQGKSSPSCGWGIGSYIVSCAPNTVCGLVNGSVEGSSILGHFKMKAYVRDCVEPVSDSDKACVSELSDFSAVINGILESALGFVEGLGSFKVNADLCTCNSDHCNQELRDKCDKGEVNIFNLVCANIWILVGIGIGVLVLLTCICCCACCCCSNNNSGSVKIYCRV